MIILMMGLLLLSSKVGFSSVVVKNADIELHQQQIPAPYPSEPANSNRSAKPKLELVIDEKNLSQSQVFGNQQKKNRRGDRVRKKKEKHGKFGRQRNKGHKSVDFDSRQVLRNNEKATLVRNRTIEILKNGVRILSASENYTHGGNKSIARVNETLLEKILSSAVSKPDLLISASGIYKLPIGGDIYNSKKLSKSEAAEENRIDTRRNQTDLENYSTDHRESREKTQSKRVNITMENSSKDYEYDYDAMDDFKDTLISHTDFNKSFGKSFTGNADYESVNLDYNIGTTLEQIVSVLHNITDSRRNCSKLFANCSEEETEAKWEKISENEDPCQKWLECKASLEIAFLGENSNLPSCPCHYPSTIFYDDKIWDEKQNRYFRWRDASSETERLDIYKPGATYCIRSLLAVGSSTISCQHCCYDRELRLLTRGSGAGTVNFVSPDVSKRLHDTVDMLPWRLCKGDFTRYNIARQPDNGNSCPVNPDNDRYQLQVEFSKYF